MTDDSPLIVIDELGDVHVPTEADIRLTECNKYIGEATWSIAQAPTLITCTVCATALTGSPSEPPEF